MYATKRFLPIEELSHKIIETVNDRICDYLELVEESFESVSEGSFDRDLERHLQATIEALSAQFAQRWQKTLKHSENDRRKTKQAFLEKSLHEVQRRFNAAVHRSVDELLASWCATHPEEARRLDIDTVRSIAVFDANNRLESKVRLRS